MQHGSEKMNVDTRMAVTLGKRQLADSIWKAAGIEGLGTTFPNTEKILENLPVHTCTAEVFFIINMKRAWSFLFDNIDYPEDFALLRQLNKICLDNLEYGGGEMRKFPVAIGGSSWKPLIPDEITVKEEFGAIAGNVRTAESPMQQLNGILDLFCYVCRTQIFVDGNKRAAQLIANKLLMQQNLGILSIPYERIDEFKERLVSFYESGDNGPLKQFLFHTSLLLMEPELLQQDGLDMESYAPYVNNVISNAPDLEPEQS